MERGEIFRKVGLFQAGLILLITVAVLTGGLLYFLSHR